MRIGTMRSRISDETIDAGTGLGLGAAAIFGKGGTFHSRQ
jgi:hypothetical protein